MSDEVIRIENILKGTVIVSCHIKLYCHVSNAEFPIQHPNIDIENETQETYTAKINIEKIPKNIKNIGGCVYLLLKKRGYYNISMAIPIHGPKTITACQDEFIDEDSDEWIIEKII